jgi:hypothetical protein
MAMHKSIPKADEVLARLATLKNTVAKRLALGPAMPGDDAINQAMIEKVMRAETVAAIYFTQHAFLLNTDTPVTATRGNDLRVHLSNFSEAPRQLDELAQDMDKISKARPASLSPLFALKVRGEREEVGQLEQMLSLVWLRTAQNIAAREKAFTASRSTLTLVKTGPAHPGQD